MLLSRGSASDHTFKHGMSSLRILLRVKAVDWVLLFEIVEAFGQCLQLSFAGLNLDHNILELDFIFNQSSLVGFHLETWLVDCVILNGLLFFIVISIVLPLPFVRSSALLILIGSILICSSLVVSGLVGIIFDILNI